MRTFVFEEKERSISPIVDLRDINGSPETAAIVVGGVRCQLLAKTALEKQVRIDGGVSKILVQRAVRIVSTGLNHDICENSGRTTIFSRQRSGENLDFADGLGGRNPG